MLDKQNKELAFYVKLGKFWVSDYDTEYKGAPELVFDVKNALELSNSESALEVAQEIGGVAYKQSTVLERLG